MKLSVITINLNDKAGLEKTMNSLLSQTFTDYEFIVIDGGSTDGSVDIIKAHQDRISYWVSEPDKGIYNAMNKGIVEAKGEYCYFLNSGDYLASDDVLGKIFESDPHESFLCGNFFYEENGVLSRQDDYKYRDWNFSLYDIYSTYLCHQAFFIRRDNFEKYGLYDERFRILSDWRLFLEAIGVKHESVRYFDVDLVAYNLGGLSYTIGGKAIYREKVEIAQEMLSPYLFNRIDRLYNIERRSHYIDFSFSKKWINFVMRGFMKICTVLRLTKF